MVPKWNHFIFMHMDYSRLVFGDGKKIGIISICLLCCQPVWYNTKWSSSLNGNKTITEWYHLLATLQIPLRKEFALLGIIVTLCDITDCNYHPLEDIVFIVVIFTPQIKL